jgi:NADH:ubiquinone oxidoreductase subunit K
MHDSVPETGKWLRSVLQGYHHTVAAAESAIGLAILVVLFRN